MKKRIVTIALVVALLATCFGGTLAFLKDTDAQVNTFTTGNVYITLDESVVSNVNGNLVATGTRTSTTQNYHLFPGMTVDKDPTITLNAGSEDAYLAAKVTVTSAAGTDIHSLIGIEYGHMLALQGFLKGGCAEVGATEQTGHPLNGRNGIRVYGDGTYSVWQEIINNEGQYTYVFYVFIEGAKSAGYSVKLFEQMVINPAWDNAEMNILNGVNIKVEAFGVQANGFTSCYQAMTEAFGNQFNFK